MKKTGGIFHDRFIVLDYGTADERVFLCGASSKDAGARITSIVEDYGISKYAPVIATSVWKMELTDQKKLENGELVIAEDEVEIIQMIFDRYIHTNDGINGVAN